MYFVMKFADNINLLSRNWKMRKSRKMRKMRKMIFNMNFSKFSSNYIYNYKYSQFKTSFKPNKMSSFEKAVSRSQLYASDENNDVSDLSNSDNDQEYNLPPPGFDFEIVDIADNEDNEDNNEVSDTENKSGANKEIGSHDVADGEKVEFFPLFSTLGNTDSDSKNLSNLVQIKVNTIEEIVGEETKNVKLTDSEWDDLAAQRNKSFRPLSYYLQLDPINDNELEKIQSVAVDGDTILKWNKEFAIKSNYKLIDLKEYNAKIDLYHKIEMPATDKSSKKRPSKRKRDAKIFKKERVKKWKSDLKQAKERARREKYKQINSDTTSTKVKFGDSFNKRRSGISSNKGNSSTNTVSKNIGKPGKPVFRTE